MVGRSGPQPEVGWQITPLIGREREQGLLRSSLDAALNGQGGLVLISGEAGIGKTTLVEALAREAAGLNARTLTGHCYDLSTTPPYGPWMEIAERCQRLGISQAFPASLRDDEALIRVHSQSALFIEVRAVFEALALQSPTVIVLEDLHWADAASIELLRYLARQLPDMRILLAVTYRDDEVTRRQPLHQILPLVVRESRAHRVELQRLDINAIAQLVRERYQLAPKDEQRLLRYVLEHTGGNPFFLSELLRALEREAILRSIDTGWSLTELTQIQIPALVRQFIELRLGRLSPSYRELLECAAVIGQSVPLSLWRSVTLAEETELFQTIDAAIEANILVDSQHASELRFTHALVREVLYSAIPHARRRILHRLAGEHLVQLVRSDPNAIAHHFSEADDERAVEWFIRAAEEAERSYAWVTASERYLSAVHVLDSMRYDASRARQRGWLLYHIGRLVRFADPARGIKYLEDAELVALDTDDLRLAAYVLTDRGFMRCMSLDIERGLVEAEEGLAAIERAAREQDNLEHEWIAVTVADAPPAQERTRRLRAASGRGNTDVITRRGTLVLWLAWAGRYADALAIGEPFLDEARDVPFARDGYADALHGVAMAYAAMGWPDCAREIFAEAREAYIEINHHILVGVSSIDELIEIHLHYSADQVAERQSLIAGLEGANVRGSGATLDERVVRLITLASFVSGDWDARDDTATDPDRMMRYWLMAPALGRIAHARGETDLAWSAVHDGLPEGPSTEPGNGVFQSDLVRQRLAVDLALDAGDLLAARAWLECYDRWIAWSGDVRGLAASQLMWARYALTHGDPDRALQHVSRALPLAHHPRQPLLLLALYRLRGRITASLERYEDAAQDLSTALALADDCAAPHEKALTLIALAELQIATSDVTAARMSLDDAETICMTLNAQPALDQIQTLRMSSVASSRPEQFPAGLTTREVDVLRLVAEGLSDAEVGERLYISRRTVTSHLTSIYTKLGVSSRAAATRFAVEQNLTWPAS